MNAIPVFGTLLAQYDVRRWELLVCALLGLVFACVVSVFVPPMAAVLGGYLLFTMLLVMLIDCRHFIIPDVLSLPAIPPGLLAAASAFPGEWREIVGNHLFAAALAAGAFWAIRWGYKQMRGIEGLGLGDVKLAAAAGAWLGMELLPLACLLATGAALTAVLVGAFFNRPTLQSRVPFGSFIAPSIVIIWIFRIVSA
jgi:leader peptidase (prepilin peptidase)/N-methyltransferase